jgi:hypothetical protein
MQWKLQSGKVLFTVQKRHEMNDFYRQNAHADKL